MNTSRVVILGVAALAAGGAAFIARGLLGGGTEKVKALPAPAVAMSEVLVASSEIPGGTALTPSAVRWQEWPKSSVDSSFITQNGNPDIGEIVKGAVVRAPIVAGQPITPAMMVHADSVGFMAAMVSPGMRAISVAVSTESGAGGFILPNDRVDVILTAKISDQPVRYGARTILDDVRVLAVDQTYKEDSEQKAIPAKTATLELTPVQAQLVEQAASTGTLSLALRALGDNGAQNKSMADGGSETDNGPTVVIRYAVPKVAPAARE
jgi:pilus assembly protein CpaB